MMDEVKLPYPTFWPPVQRVKSLISSCTCPSQAASTTVRQICTPMLFFVSP